MGVLFGYGDVEEQLVELHNQSVLISLVEEIEHEDEDGGKDASAGPEEWVHLFGVCHDEQDGS